MRNSNGNRADENTERDADENGYAIGLLQRTPAVAEQLGNFVERFLIPDNLQHVTELKLQLAPGGHLNFRARHAGDSHAEAAGKIEFLDGASQCALAGHNY